jgi:mannose-6-phosphate isomerase
MDKEKTKDVSIPSQKPETVLVRRPWGRFWQYAHNQAVTVSLMQVEPGQSLSLQAHRKRAELWIVLDEGACIEVNGETFFPKAGEEFWIGANVAHRLKGAEAPVRVLEVAFGDWQQADIQRFDDQYHRSPTEA